MSSPRRPRIATVWLGGCSGCTMSFLDLDERLLELAARADLVYSPIADAKEYPEDVDAALVEGAVANEDNLEMVKKVRARTKVLIALGDCAATANVTGLRNPLPLQKVLAAAEYREMVDPVPRLLPRVRPIHKVVPVDGFLPGCPPTADAIWAAVTALLDGRPLREGDTAARFG